MPHLHCQRAAKPPPMSRRRISRVAGPAVCSLLAGFALAACDAQSADEAASAASATTKIAASSQATTAQDQAGKPKLGLMTGLPLYWPLGADFGDLAGGNVEAPWQRAVLERDHQLVLLDTLTPIPGLASGDPETDPLAGLERLAIIQPRGLSPLDNVALDDWVRAGGHLLIALDPMLTGEYEVALGDPRRPSAVALFPPVIERWGMKVTYDEQQEFAPRLVTIGDLQLPVLLAGQISAKNANCVQETQSSVQQCQIGEGTVTLIADAAMFEDPDLSEPDGGAIQALFAFAFGR